MDVYLPGRVFETVVELELRGVLLRLTDRGRWFCSLDRSSLVVRFGVAEDVGRCFVSGAEYKLCVANGRWSDAKKDRLTRMDGFRN